MLCVNFQHLCIGVSSYPCFTAAAKPRKPVSSTLKHNSSLQKELANIDERKMKAVSTMPHTLSSRQTIFTQLNRASNGNEDEAYSIMHPSRTSSRTLSNAGDSGFEDVRPLQRLDQEPDTKRDLPQPAGNVKNTLQLYI